MVTRNSTVKISLFSHYHPASNKTPLLLKGVSEPRRRREPRRPVSRPERRPFKRRGVLFDALVFPHRQLRIHLAHRLKRHCDNDKQCCTADGNDGNAGNRLHDDRKDGDQPQKRGSEQRDAIHDAVEIFFRAFARPDARQQSPALLEVLCDLLRIERDRGVEIREDEHK